MVQQLQRWSTIPRSTSCFIFCTTPIRRTLSFIDHPNPSSELYWSPLVLMTHSFPPSSIPSSSPLWQDPLTPSLRFSSSSDLPLSTSRTGISPFFRCWSGPFIEVVHLNLKVRFTGIAWPPIFNLTYTRRSSFQPNAFQEKVHVEVIDRFTVCFFSLSTSVRTI